MKYAGGEINSRCGPNDSCFSNLGPSRVPRLRECELLHARSYNTLYRTPGGNAKPYIRVEDVLCPSTGWCLCGKCPKWQRKGPLVVKRCSCRLGTSYCIHSHLLSSWRNILRPFVILLSPKPEHSDKQRQTSTHQARIIHGSRRNRKRDREAKDDSETDDIYTGNTVDKKSNSSFHPEPARRNSRSRIEQMRQDSCEVGQAGQYDEGANESVEGGSRTDIDAAEERVNHCAENNGIERILVFRVDAAEEARKWSSIVACESPEYPADCEEDSYRSQQKR